MAPETVVEPTRGIDAAMDVEYEGSIRRRGVVFSSYGRTLAVEAPGAARERGSTPTGPRSIRFGCGGEEGGAVGIGFDGYEDALQGERPPGVGYIGCGTVLSCCEGVTGSGGNGGRGEVGGGKRGGVLRFINGISSFLNLSGFLGGLGGSS